LLLGKDFIVGISVGSAAYPVLSCYSLTSLIQNDFIVSHNLP